MNIKQFREFELPNIRRVVDLARKRGVPVLKHSDGNIYPIPVSYTHLTLPTN